MKHYLFEIDDENSEYEGEEFLVGAYSMEEAHDIVALYFGKVHVAYHGRLSDFDAELSGLDEY
jgi:hypothetical protein